MEIFSASQAICMGNSPVTGKYPGKASDAGSLSDNHIPYIIY